MSTQTIDLARFKNVVGFSPTFSKWGNSRRGRKDTIKTSEDKEQDQKTKERLKITKQLIKVKEYDAIITFQGEVQRWIYDQTVPSFFKDGFQLASLAAVEAIEARMRKAATVELPALVDKLIKVYPDAVSEAMVALESQFNPGDYPSEDQLRAKFKIEWNWIAFTVPEGLPEELKRTEQDKLEKQFADAGQQITLALRVAFQELIAHATERLTVQPGEQPKTFRDSLIGNLQQFISTFTNRNLMNDAELAKLVKDAEYILTGVTPEKLRTVENTRNGIRDQFAKIQSTLDTMITETKSRMIDLSDDEPAAKAA